ncbi:uncharacterized protein LOC116295769 [Actinia tenebrosa]|uniref:Uncharacterized protein LOC116295769 n=1 Tax=Actinia tenebrosa TaxID=6105 RepID=A0A6P8HT27_ACTTE|nr:uncharacterized protein LOC116295769 [Actinia tenebrosa]
METKGYMWLLFTVLSILATSSLSITLEAHIGAYIRELLQEFKNDPTSSRFDSVIHPKLLGKGKSDFFLPKVFIWSPMDHFKSTIRCPEHGSVLEAMQWTDITEKKSPRNPRLVYDLHGNYLLIQRFYKCRHGQHKYLSAAPEIMRELPGVISHGCFPIKMLYKAACSKELMDLVISEVVQGVNFLQISEGIANLNYKEFCRRGERYLMSNSNNHEKQSCDHDFFTEDFYCDTMFSFPSNDLLMKLFLEDFEGEKKYYDEELRKTKAKVLSFDHTFKVSKHIGVARNGDSQIVGQFSNLFIGLNENKDIVIWKLTRSTKFEEVKDVLVELNERIIAENERIETIYVDDCCKVRAQYKTIFRNKEDIKLDLFHGVQRVVKTLSKKSEASKRLANEFGLVFRANGDLGNVRNLPTPDPEQIEENLDHFEWAWSEILLSKEYTETRNEIDKLKVHIRKGCLSGINPGEGTEGNEVLHHFINRCLLCGSTTIGPELAIAVLTILFYSLNSKKKERKHERNARTNIYMPIEGVITKNYGLEHKKSLTKKVLQEDNSRKEKGCTTTDGKECSKDSSVLLVADHIQNLCNEVIAETILNHVETMHSILDRINKECNNRSFNILDFPILQLKGLQNVIDHFNNDGSSIEETTTTNQLARNLSGLGLEVDDVDGDGDCAFTSIMKQVIDLSLRTEGEVRDRLLLHLEVLGLNTQSVAENVNPLRQLFVDHLCESANYYAQVLGMEENELLAEAELFKRAGTYNYQVGDLVVKVCAEVLNLAIVVITSIDGAPCIPFIPPRLCCDCPIYIAFTHSGPGHYDATKALKHCEGSKEIEKGCSCGKNKSSIDGSACDVSDKTRCPCVRRGKMCSRLCRCRKCNNVMESNAVRQTQEEVKRLNDVSFACSCGRSKKNKDPAYEACKDGERKSKCKCLKYGVKCSATCECYNCCNGKSDKEKEETPSKKRRCRENPSPYKRRKGMQFLNEESLGVHSGSWTRFETYVLIESVSLISTTSITAKPKSLASLYNYVAKYANAKDNKMHMAMKTASQINGKLLHIQSVQDISELLQNK